jgi:hypothetical protein
MTVLSLGDGRDSGIQADRGPLTAWLVL